MPYSANAHCPTATLKALGPSKQKQKTRDDVDFFVNLAFAARLKEINITCSFVVVLSLFDANGEDKLVGVTIVTCMDTVHFIFWLTSPTETVFFAVGVLSGMSAYTLRTVLILSIGPT